MGVLYKRTLKQQSINGGGSILRHVEKINLWGKSIFSEETSHRVEII